MRVFGVLIGGGLALIALGIATAHWQAPGMFANVTGFGAQIENRVARAAQDVVNELGFEWVELEVNGQIVTLRGDAPREEERVMAVNAISNAMGTGGFWRGGIISVVDQSGMAPIASPFIWRVAKRDNEVRITGVVPSREVRRELLDYAQSVFGLPIRSELTIARGAPSEQSWASVARTAISEVAALDEGVAVLKDTRLTVEGQTRAAGLQARIRQELTRLPSPFVGAARLDGPAFVREDALVNATRETTIRDVSLCQAMINELLSDEQVQFEPASSLLEKDSYALLDQLALALNRCEDVQVEIQGHTDSSGEPEANQRLSRTRAQRILDYFVLNGLDSERLVAVGFGDQQPVASNDTEEGREQNRRIELVVTR